MKNLWIVLLLTTCLFAQPTAMKPMLGTQLDWGQPLTKGLVGAWFNQEAAPALGTLGDLSLNGNHGALAGDTHTVPGKFGPALDFDGVGDGVDCGSGVPVSEERTVAVWVLFRSFGNDGTIVRREGGGGTFTLDVDNATNIRWASGPVTMFVAVAGYELNRWYHIVGTMKDPGGHLYIDGVEVASDPTSTPETPTGNLYIGIEDGTLDPHDGLIGHVLIYDRALNASGVASLYRDPFQIFEQERLPITAAAAPAETGQFMFISVLPACLMIGLAGIALYSGRKAA